MTGKETLRPPVGSSDKRGVASYAMERIHRLQKSLERVQRRQRRALAVSLAVLVLILLSAAITVTGEDLEIHPNVSGGDPNDSYELKLTGDGDTGADRAMTLKTVPTTDTEYRLAIGDNSSTERVTFDDDGNLGIGNSSPSTALHVDSNAANTTAIFTVENTAGDFQVFVTTADPESAITASIGDFAIDPSNGNIWIKHEGAASNTGWDRLGPSNPFCAYDGSGSQTVNSNTYQVLNIDTVAISDPTYSLASDEITFNRGGVYRVTVNIGYETEDNTGGDGGSMLVRVQEDTGTGNGFVGFGHAGGPTPGASYSGFGSIHYEGMDRFGGTETWIRSFNASDKIRVRFKESTGSQELGLLAGGSRITIERVN